MTRKSLILDDKLYDYLLSVSLHETPILQDLREETATLPMARMQIAPEQGQFMAFLIKSLNVTKAIEIGVYTGYSSLVTALSIPDNGTLIACDIDPEMTAIATRYWEKAGINHKIDLRLDPAIKTLDNLLDENLTDSFDFAFIDAHKPEYIDYYERTLKLIKPGGVILVDNVLWGGNPVDQDKQDEDTVAIRQFNEHVYSDERVFLSMLPIADGLSMILKK